MNQAPDIKMVRGSIVIKIEPHNNYSDADIFEILKKVKTRTYVLKINGITFQRFNVIKNEIIRLKRKKFIFEYYFDLEETNDLIHGTITMCYNNIM